MLAHDQFRHEWSRRRWIGLILLCFLVQIVLIVLLGERRTRALTAMPFKTRVHLLNDPWSIEQLSSFTDISDPSVFALPSPQGFSGATWLAFKTIPDEFAEAHDEPKWLQLDPDHLGSRFAEFMASNSLTPIRIADESMPELAGLQPRVSAELQFPKSELRISGALMQRKPLKLPELPSWPHTDVLTNSVIYTLVDAEGVPLSSALVSSSGLKDADNFALAVSKRLRFKPLRSGGSVASGTLNFLWHTLPPTNLSPGLTLP